MSSKRRWSHSEAKTGPSYTKRPAGFGLPLAGGEASWTGKAGEEEQSGNEMQYSFGAWASAGPHVVVWPRGSGHVAGDG